MWKFSVECLNNVGDFFACNVCCRSAIPPPAHRITNQCYHRDEREFLSAIVFR